MSDIEHGYRELPRGEEYVVDQIIDAVDSWLGGR